MRKKKEDASKATLYGVGLFGQVWREEGWLVCHGTTDSIAANHLETYGPAPKVVFRARGERRNTLYVKADGNRYLLALAGWGHPSPPRRPPCKDDTNMVDFDEVICEHVRANEVEVLARYGRPGPCASCGAVGVAGHAVRGDGPHPGYWICEECYEAEFAGIRLRDEDLTRADRDTDDRGFDHLGDRHEQAAYIGEYKVDVEEHAKARLTEVMP